MTCTRAKLCADMQSFHTESILPLLCMLLIKPQCHMQGSSNDPPDAKDGPHPPFFTCTWRTASKKCFSTRRAAAQTAYYHWNHRPSASLPALLSFLTLLILPAQSIVSVAFGYCIYTQGLERAGRNSITHTKPTTTLQASPQHCSPLHRGSTCMPNTRVHLPRCCAEAQCAPILMRHSFGSNLWPAVSSSNRKRNCVISQDTLYIALQSSVLIKPHY